MSIDVGGADWISHSDSSPHFGIAVNLGVGGTAPGKTLTITASTLSGSCTIVNYMPCNIYTKFDSSISNLTSATIDLNGVKGMQDSPFAVKLCQGTSYCFASNANRGDSSEFGAGHKLVGLGVAHLGDGIGSPDYIRFTPNGATVKWWLLGSSDSWNGGGTWATLFGAAYANRAPHGLAHWQLDAFGDGNNLQANAHRAAALAGVGHLDKCNDIACDWSITGFGNSNSLSTRAKDTGSSESSDIFHHSGSAVLFGVAYGEGSPNSFCRWKIGPFTDVSDLAFGGNNTLSAEANWSRSTDDYLHAHANLFGAGYLYESNNSLCDWSIGSFGQNASKTGNTLTAKATATNSSSPKDTYAEANLFGAACNFASHKTFLNWTIGNFFDGQTLLAQATANRSSGNPDGYFAYAHANLFGVGYNFDSADSFCDWSIGNFGQDSTGAGNSLIVTALAQSYCQPYAEANLFGAACNFESQKSFLNWTIGNFFDGQTLSAQATANRSSGSPDGYFAYAHANLFGVGYNFDSADSFCDWSIGNFGQDSTGAGNSLTATALAQSYCQPYAEANLFGVACNLESQKSFLNWTIGNFFDGQTLLAQATANRSSGSPDGYFAYAHANLFGAGYNFVSDNSFCGWSIGSFGDSNNLRSSAKVVLGASCCTYAESNLFGAACNHRSANTFCNWAIGDIGAGNLFLAHADATSGGVPPFTHANLFGAGCNFCSPNAFRGWAIGDMGQNNTFVTVVANNARSDSYNITYANLFGAACNYGGQEFLSSGNIDEVAQPDIPCTNSFCNWTIGAFGNNTSLTASATAIGYNGSDLHSLQVRASLFGAAYNVYAPNSFCNWTAEFQGNATLAVFGADNGGLGGVNTFLAALGGDGNGSAGNFYDGMRFYFNDLSFKEGPSVVSTAAKLDSYNWSIGNGIAKATFLSDQDGYQTRGTGKDTEVKTGIFPRAVALGPNFQLNVGRARVLDASWASNRKAGPNQTVCSNGTWETDDSIRSGGSAANVGPGTLHLLGAIAKGQTSDGTAGSILRIDSDWTVKCYAPVQDLQSIVIHNGTMELKSSRDSDFTAAIGQLNGNVAYVDPTTGELYQGDGSRPGRSGGISIDASAYPVYGTLTLDGSKGETIRFGVELGDNIYKESGALVLTGDIGATQEQLILTGGVHPTFGLAVDPKDLIDSLPIKCRGVQTASANTTIMKNLLGGIDRSEKKIDGANCYFLDGDLSNSLVLKDINPYVSIDNLYLLWSEEEGAAGLVLMTLDKMGNGAGMAPLTKTESGSGSGSGSESGSGSGSGSGSESEPQGGDGSGAQAALPNWLPTEYAKTFVNGELAQLGSEVNWAFARALSGLLLDQRGQRDPVFVLGIHSLLHRNTFWDFGYRGTISGGLIGWDTAQPVADAALLRCGVCAAHVHANMRCSGAAAALGRKIRQNHWLGALFATLEHRSANGLEGSLCATLGGGYLRNRAERIDNDTNHFRARFDGKSVFLSTEYVQNVFRCCGMQIGPWFALHYDWQRQNEYAEISSATVGATSLSDVDHSIASSLLGIHFEWECDRKERGASAFGKFGWHCQALRHHSDAIATVQGTPLGGFLPYQHYGARHAISVTLGIRGRFNRHWSCDGQWHGDFARGKHDNHLSAQLCHHF